MNNLQRMGRPSECSICDQLRHKTRVRARLKMSQVVAVKTWCRICGLPVLLNIVRDYAAAVRFLYGLDDEIASHYDHEEAGGWGRHWRFDEVLRAAFPVESRADDDHWPAPPWYEHIESMEMEVEVLTQTEAQLFGQRADPRRLRIEHELNRNPRSREELEASVGEVWDEEELLQHFDVLGFRAPFALVVRRSDGAKGSLVMQQDPRFYFGFEVSRVL